MPDHAKRECPVCGFSFVPLSTTAGACSKTCSKQATYLRATGDAYEQGKASITVPALEILIRIRQMDDRTAEAMPDTLVEDPETSDEEEWIAEQQAEREWDAKTAEPMRTHRKRLLARGWKPIPFRASPSESRRRCTLTLNNPKPKSKL